MIKKIPKITSEGIHYLFYKAHKFENQLIIIIYDKISNNDNNNRTNNSSSINNNNANR